MQKTTNAILDLHVLIGRYTHMTKDVLPEMAKSDEKDWPVTQDHCFQRIVLDTICNGPWYEWISSPAYKNLNATQAYQAIRLCEDIIAGRVDLGELNQQSISWRKKQHSFPF